ncbi:ferritin-like domain-containing protein [Bacillota bacterium LX-D]|nr:ferritin-like domain-containing protein [Bacillota bacterium LX-D]
MAEYSRREWLEKIHDAVRDEAGDAAYYRQLSGMAPNYEARQMIRSMENDEMRHHRELKELYQSMKGKKSTYEQSKPVIHSYKDALETRFHAETNDFNKYKGYYLSADNKQMRDLFFDIMHDEAKHAMYLQYLMQKHCCMMMKEQMEEHMRMHEEEHNQNQNDQYDNDGNNNYNPHDQEEYWNNDDYNDPGCNLMSEADDYYEDYGVEDYIAGADDDTTAYDYKAQDYTVDDYYEVEDYMAEAATDNDVKEETSYYRPPSYKHKPKF